MVQSFILSHRHVCCGDAPLDSSRPLPSAVPPGTRPPRRPLTLSSPAPLLSLSPVSDSSLWLWRPSPPPSSIELLLIFYLRDALVRPSTFPWRPHFHRCDVSTIRKWLPSPLAHCSIFITRIIHQDITACASTFSSLPHLTIPPPPHRPPLNHNGQTLSNTGRHLQMRRHVRPPLG